MGKKLERRAELLSKIEKLVDGAKADGPEEKAVVLGVVGELFSFLDNVERIAIALESNARTQEDIRTGETRPRRPVT